MILSSKKEIDLWLNILREHINIAAPELISIFEVYAAEAKFGRAFIEDDLKELSAGASILEVGAGAMILSCQLVFEGFRVVALEPTGEGFSHFNQLREIVLEQANRFGQTPEILSIYAENLNLHDHFQFAFSINVMEHVSDVESVIRNVYNSLHKGATYHFTCPNYLFPYEPHFNIPTLFNKKLTEIIFSKIIKQHNDLLDPLGTWHSLNWISVTQLLKMAKKNKNISLILNKRILSETLLRVTTDNQFAKRRSYWMRVLIRCIVTSRLQLFLAHMPPHLQPIIDCKIKIINKIG